MTSFAVIIEGKIQGSEVIFVLHFFPLKKETIQYNGTQSLYTCSPYVTENTIIVILAQELQGS